MTQVELTGIRAAASARVRDHRYATRELLTAALFLLPSLLVFTVFLFWPLLRSAVISTYGNDIIGRPTRFIGSHNYQLLLSQPELRDVLLNTLLFTLYTVVPAMVIGIGLALLLQLRVAGIGLFRTLLATPFGFSVATASAVFGIFFNPGVGVLNGFLYPFHIHPVGWLTSPATALIAVAATTVWLQLGYNVLVLSAGLQAIPEDVYEAARLDGATGLSLLRHVTLPLLTPSLFFLLVVSTIQSLQSFGQIDILTKGGPARSTTTLVYDLYLNAFAFGNSNFGLASAIAMVLFLLVVIVTALQFGVLERRVFYR